jgi:hypothetical protein
MASSLASATNSRVDSASKHIVACRVNTDYMKMCCHVGGNNEKELKANKMKYCMNKDEIVMGIGRPFRQSSNINTMKAYPSVITTMGNTSSKLMQAQSELSQKYFEQLPGTDTVEDHINTISALTPTALTQWQASKTIPEQNAKKAKELATEKEKKYLDNGHNMYFVGISVGVAYAHPSSGDTVGSVMIGGLRTIRNGPAEIHTGDPVFWVSDWEAKNLFLHPNGKYDDTLTKNQIDAQDAPVGTKRKWTESQNGNTDRSPGKTNMFTLMPFLMSTDDARYNEFKARIFGRSDFYWWKIRCFTAFF